MVNFQTGFKERFALFLGEQLSDLRCIFLDQLARVHQRSAAIFGRNIGPDFKGVFGGSNRLLHVLVIALRYGVDGCTGGGIAYFASVLGYRIDGFPADKHLGHFNSSVVSAN
jgi:hypothetical protein